MGTEAALKEDGARRRKLLLLALGAAGLAVRAAYVLWTRDAAAHPDLGSFLPSALPLAHPFDTSPREPFFVWWLWLLGKLGITSTAGIRLATSAWFLPSLPLLFRLASRLLGARPAWAAAALYAFLPGQVQFDTVGLRHLIETFCVLLLLDALSADPALRRPRNWLGAAGAAAVMLLTRVSFAGSGLFLAAWAGLKGRSWRPLPALLPAFLLLAGHLQNNYARHGDAFHSVNIHAHFFSNMEYIGQPGFPATFEEWQKDAYAPRLNFRQWAFGRHTLPEIAGDSLVGLWRAFWDFYLKVYFALGLPAAAAWALMALYALGTAAALASAGLRAVPLWMLLLALPYAFVAHVFWAGRFFAPSAPLALLLTVKGGAVAWKPARRAFLRFTGKPA